MRKGDMMELIQRLIHDEAIVQLKKKRNASPHDPPSMSDDELDLILFHGGMEPMNESFENTAKIGTSDITEFENQMHDMLSNIPNAILTFDKQANGRSILLKNGNGSVDVMASGKIEFGNEGRMTWMFSIPNGFRISTDDGIQITQENRDVFSDMFNYYSTWQKDWRQKLLAPDGGEDDSPVMDPMAAQQGTAPPASGDQPSMDVTAQQGATPQGNPPAA